jgi:hypothetical protein
MSGAPPGYNPESTLPLPSGGGPDIVAVRGGGKGDDIALGNDSGFPDDGTYPVLRYDITKKQYVIIVKNADSSKYAIYDADLKNLQSRASDVAKGTYKPTSSTATPLKRNEGQKTRKQKSRKNRSGTNKK